MTLKKVLLAVCLLHFSCAAFVSAASARTDSRAASAVNVFDQQADAAGVFNVRAFGAKGDGHALDSPSVNRAIDAAAAAGGGTVRFPAGTYRCFSIRLKSNITLYLDQGATILAADPRDGDGKYDLPEPNPWDKYQDFGHSHWHNSLIWGENIENVSILGPGLINGKGLVRSGAQSRTREQNEVLGTTNPEATPFGYPNPRDAVEPGWGNKSISLKLCRNVTIKDISILHGGHFAVLATGVDNLTIDNVKIDTNRDGIDIDCCRQVRVSNCTVNSPFDDGICPKSTFSLGFARATENVTITNCAVSGYDEGTLLDGTYKREYRREGGGEFSPTGRIKFGTESNGGFKNITISNCVFDYSRGLALETVDGGLLEDVTITNITMRDISNSPFFLRLGSRLRGPKETTAVGALRRVLISNVVVYNADPRYASIVSGIPGHAVEDVRFTNIRVYYRGGGTPAQAALDPPEKEDAYPEPSMFGEMPAYGFFIRHARGLEMRDVQVGFLKDDVRPPFVLSDVSDAEFFRLKAQRAADAPIFVLKNVNGFSLQQSWPLPDTRLERTARKRL